MGKGAWGKPPKDDGPFVSWMDGDELRVERIPVSDDEAADIAESQSELTSARSMLREYAQKIEHYEELLKIGEDENARLRTQNAALVDALLTMIGGKVVA